MSAFFGRFRGVRPSPWRALALVLGLLVVAVLIVVAKIPKNHLPKYEKVDEIVYLNQGWGPAREEQDRQAYYYTPQGTSVKNLRYKWFTSLEQPWNRKPFVDPDHMRAFGFLVDLAPTPRNPDLLPVGFTRHYDPDLQDELLDITCATCHTGQITVKKNGKTIGIRIDGGEARHAFTDMGYGHFIPEMILSMTVTLLDPFTFNRFAHKVLGDKYYDEGKHQLARELRSVLLAFAKQGWTDTSRHLYPVEEGFGRTDAIGRIANTVYGDHISEANYHVGDAPVSYPPVWDIWKFDWVQYGASVRHPLARNVGEGMGVGAKYSFFDAYGRPIPRSQRYQASTLIDQLMVIEGALQRLTPPQWPEELLGPIDCQKATAGKTLFLQHCYACHGTREAGNAVKQWDAPGKLVRDDRMRRNDALFGLDHLSDPSKLYHWVVKTLPVSVIGTDPKSALNFVNNRVDLSPTGMTNQELRELLEPLLREDLARRLQPYAKDANNWQSEKTNGEAAIQSALKKIDVHSVSTGEGLNYFGLLIRQQYRKDPRFQAAEHGQNYAATEGPDDDLFFGEIDLPQTPLAYKARPLAGMWATAPYLHNGSVPNIYQLLLPATRRDRKFFVGRTEYDTRNLGYSLQPLSDSGFWLDTSIPGNSNTGHEFRAGYVGRSENGVIGPELTDDQRFALIEYLKVHQDTPGIQELPQHCVAQ